MFKEQEKQDLKDKIKDSAYCHLNMPDFNSYETIDNFMINVRHAIEGAVRNAICNTVDAIVDELYTQDDFERDVGLRD